LIYSEQFEALPNRIKKFIGQRLRTILLGGVNDTGYQRLTPADRKAVAEILAETKGEFWETYVLADAP
jgi:hypothetical protein